MFVIVKNAFINAYSSAMSVSNHQGPCNKLVVQEGYESATAAPASEVGGVRSYIRPTRDASSKNVILPKALKGETPEGPNLRSGRSGGGGDGNGGEERVDQVKGGFGNDDDDLSCRYASV